MLQKQKVNKYLSKSWRTGKIEFERSAKNCPQSMHVGALPWSWKEKQKKCFPPFAWMHFCLGAKNRG